MRKKRAATKGRGDRKAQTTTRVTSAARTRSMAGYDDIRADIVALLEGARNAAARTVNALMTATYWEVGRRIVEFEQSGRRRAGYGEALIERLSSDLSARLGRGFGRQNLQQMRLFYLAWPLREMPQTVSARSGRRRRSLTPSANSGTAGIRQTASGKSSSVAIRQTASGELPDHSLLAGAFPLPWSAYVRLLSVKSPQARAFYEAEALRNGWSVRQLARQIDSQFYERTALSRNKAAVLAKGAVADASDALTPEEAIRDPYVLEFLQLKDEYSETQLEEALTHRLEDFLLELGGDFTFVGRQRRLRIGDSWFRVDLLFFHRRLRCLVIVDLKLTALHHADVGQMHLYCNYAREHWMLPGENPPVGLILCARRDEALARYALEGLSNKVLAAEYRMVLPDEQMLVETLQQARREVERKGIGRGETGGGE